jgi:hypothetical protein
MTLRAICGQYERTLSSSVAVASVTITLRVVWHLRFIERRVEKSKAIPSAKLIVNAARRWVSESPVQLMRLYAQDIVGRGRVTCETIPSAGIIPGLSAIVAEVAEPGGRHFGGVM